MFASTKKGKKNKASLRGYISIDPYNGSYYLFRDGYLRSLHKLGYSKANFITSFIANKDIITATVYISRSIPEEDIADVLDIKAYEELGLDQANHYIISHYEMPTEEEERAFHIFVVEAQRLDELFLPIKESTKYIDLILPAPLMYRPLYTKEILNGSGVDCFIYFMMEDAFITFYKDGEYIYSKSISYSLSQIYEKFCELVGEKVDEKEFFLTLENEGLKSTKNEYQQNLMKIFGDVYITINDVIIYVKRAYKLETIHHLYIGTGKGTIVGLDEYSQNYLGLHSSDLNFDFSMKTEEWYISQHHYLLLLNGLDYAQDQWDLVNLSAYPRPPMFLNRPSGQFIISVFLAVSIALGYPLYFLVNAYINEATVHALRGHDQRLAAEVEHYKKAIAQKREQLKKFTQEAKALQETYNAKTKTLQAVYDKKINYRLKSGIYHEMANLLIKHNVYIEQIATKGDRVYLFLVSVDDRKITRLIQEISEYYFSQIEHIDIKQIDKEHEEDLYRGVLEVVLK